MMRHECWACHSSNATGAVLLSFLYYNAKLLNSNLPIVWSKFMIVLCETFATSPFTDCAEFLIHATLNICLFNTTYMALDASILTLAVVNCSWGHANAGHFLISGTICTRVKYVRFGYIRKIRQQNVLKWRWKFNSWFIALLVKPFVINCYELNQHPAAPAEKQVTVTVTQ